VTLTTRKPTGAVPWPLILIEGEEKAGKTWACAEFTASPRVGRCFWIDLGEGAADEYGAIPGADYEIVEHDGSWGALYQNVVEIHAIAREALARGDKPVVLVIDTMTSEWDLLKDWTTDRAKSSRSNRAKLECDPNAEIKISPNYWNDANARHRTLMRLLKTFPGIALMTAHGKPVASIGDDGQPVEGKKEHKVEAQKSLGADASCWLRLFREEPGIIVGGRSVHLQFRPGDKPRALAADWSLEAIVFDVLKCDPAKAHARALVDPKADAVTPEQIRDEALHPRTTVERERELYKEAKRLGYDDVVLMNETGEDEGLIALLERVGAERAGTSAPSPATDSNGHSPAPEPPAGGPWVAEWRSRLASAPEGKLAGLQREVGSAVARRQITTEQGSELSGEVRARRAELASVAA
jgi:AAA domain